MLTGWLLHSQHKHLHHNTQRPTHTHTHTYMTAAGSLHRFHCVKLHSKFAQPLFSDLRSNRSSFFPQTFSEAACSLTHTHVYALFHSVRPLWFSFQGFSHGILLIWCHHTDPTHLPGPASIHTFRRGTPRDRWQVSRTFLQRCQLLLLCFLCFLNFLSVSIQVYSMIFFFSRVLFHNLNLHVNSEGNCTKQIVNSLKIPCVASRLCCLC